MYEIITLTHDNIALIKTIENKHNIFVCGANTFNAIYNYDRYPLKNKKLAIKNMLIFLQYVDTLLNDKTTVAISANKIREIFTGAKYRAYIDILAELDIITRVPYADGKFYDYGNTKRNCQYRIHNQYLLDKVCLVIAPKDKPTKLITDKKYPAKFEKTIRYTTCNYSEAIKDEVYNYVLTGMPENKLRIRLSRLLALNNDRYIKQGGKVDRVYHSFSTLSKISRKHLQIGNKVFHDIDIKNCQPLLLCYLLRKLNMGVDCNYIHDCETGNVYERFITMERDRDNVKVELYSAIYFDFKAKKAIANEFEILYPLTYQSLQILDGDPVTLASKLQNIEASIFNGLKPKKSKFYFTLFDAIYFTDSADIQNLVGQLQERFAVHGITPKFSINCQ